MTTVPTFAPGDSITNPRLFALARERWPSVPVVSGMLADIAELTGEPLFVEATPENVKAGMIEAARERRRAEQTAEIAADYRRIGFDPSRNYRAPSLTTEK
jgi:hypothetical protein